MHIQEVLGYSDPISVDFSKAHLDLAFNEAIRTGKTPKALLLTNPGNPLGNIYSKDTLQLAISWARDKNLHIICDEIYALSIINSNLNKFQSIVSLMNNQLGNYIHVIWGISKDFGSSGFRLGVLYTQNKLLLNVLNNIGFTFTSSNIVQVMYILHILY